MYNYYFFSPPLQFNTLEHYNNYLVSQTAQNSIQTIENMKKKYDLLLKDYKKLEKENSSLKLEIEQLNAYQEQPRKRKFKRRSDNQLSRDFKCPFEACHKEYASELALNYHMRKKHNAGTKKQRIRIIQKVLNAEQLGQEKPQIPITLPPNYVEEFEKVFQHLVLKKHYFSRNKFQSKKISQQQ